MTQTVTTTPLPVLATWQAKGRAIAQDLATLVLLTLALPLNAAVVLPTWLISALSHGFRSSRTATMPSKTVLISGGKMTKALQLARSFSQAGHRVLLIETHKYWLSGHRFSRAVDRFYTVPKPDSPDYASALLRIVQQEQVDTYIPVCSPVASYYDAQASILLSKHCEVIHVDPEKIALLDDKYQFAKTAESIGLSVPKSFCITEPRQVLEFDFSQEQHPYILKSIPYDSVRRLDLTKLPCESPEATAAFVHSLPISEHKPWVMQEFITGKEYCTHSTLRQGELRLHCCCESSAFQVNYDHVNNLKIEDWVRRFTAHLNLTGQASFDFIEADDGEVYAIECNPRTHSAITLFYDDSRVANAYLNRESQPEPVLPPKTTRPTYWLYHEIWRLLTHLYSPSDVSHRLSIILRGKDAIFDWRDPLPFLMVHHWQIPLLLLADLRQMKGWIRIDFNIGKLVQLGGD